MCDTGSKKVVLGFVPAYFASCRVAIPTAFSSGGMSPSTTPISNRVGGKSLGCNGINSCHLSFPAGVGSCSLSTDVLVALWACCLAVWHAARCDSVGVCLVWIHVLGVCRLMRVASMGTRLARKNQTLVCHMAQLARLSKCHVNCAKSIPAGAPLPLRNPPSHPCPLMPLNQTWPES